MNGTIAAGPLDDVLLHQARGLCLRMMGRLPEAAVVFDYAVALAEAADLSEESARVLISRAGNHVLAGRLSAAIADIDLAEQRADAATRAEALHQRAAVLAMAGRYEEGVTAQTKALAHFRRTGASLWEARALNNRSQMHLLAGDCRRGIGDARAAIRAYRAIDHESGVAKCTHNLAGFLAWSGRIIEALGLFEEAEQLMRQLDLPIGHGADSRIEALLIAGLFAEAFEAAVAAVDEHRALGAMLLEAEALYAASRAALALGDEARTTTYSRLAEDAFTAQQRPEWASRARLVSALATRGGDVLDSVEARKLAANLSSAGWTDAASVALHAGADAAWRSGDLETARSLLEESLGMRAGGIVAGVRRHEARIRLALIDGDPQRALRIATDGARLIRRHRNMLGSIELRSAASTLFAGLHQLGLQAAFAIGDPSAIWRWDERSRASALTGLPDSGSRVPEAPQHDALDELVAQHRAICARMDAIALDDSEAAVDAATIRSLVTRRDEVEKELRHLERTGPTHGSVEGTTRTVARGVGAALGSRSLVQLVEVDGLTCAIRFTEGNRASIVRVAASPVVEAALDRMRAALQRALRSPDDRSVERVRDRITAFDDLMGPAIRTDVTQPTDRRPEIVMVPTGRLYATPWGLLPSLKGSPITVALAATLWARTAPPERLIRVAAIDGPGLPAAVRESATIAALWSKREHLTGPASTVAAVRRSLRRCDVVHVAAHASLRPDNPSFSALHLVDGPLYVRDLSRTDITAQVAVLSACASATPLGHRGAEMQGLAASLVARGVRSVIAPVVPIADEAVTRPMEQLHSLLRRQIAPADALAAVVAASHTDPITELCAGAFICLGRGS